MTKSLTILAVAALFLVAAPMALADQENLTLAEAYQAQAANCNFSQGAVVGEAWDECEQYIYEFANLAAALPVAATSTSEINSQEIIDLLNQIAALNAALTELRSQ